MPVTEVLTINTAIKSQFTAVSITLHTHISLFVIIINIKKQQQHDKKTGILDKSVKSNL